MKRKDILIFLFCCLFDLVFLFQSVPTAFAEIGNEIVFYTSEGPPYKYQIYSINANGSGQINLSNDLSRFYLDPNWSPDGTKLLYRTGGELWVMNSDGSNRVQLTFWGVGGLSVAVWSPDGSTIAFVDGGNGFGDAAIYLMNVNDSSVRWLTDIALAWEGIWEYGIDWSPDSRKIVFSRVERNDRRVNLYTINADGSGEVALTQAADLEYYINPAWSPDGARIAFAAPTGPATRRGTDIFVMDSDGSNRHQITSLSTFALHPSWSPDGRQIVFTAKSGFDPPFNLHLMNADGTDLLRLTQNAFDSLAPRWKPAPRAVISGRVVTGKGLGLRNAVVTITHPGGVIKRVSTSSLGFYLLDNIRSGQTYTVQVTSKRHRFEPRTITVDQNLANIDFVGLE